MSLRLPKWLTLALLMTVAVPSGPATASAAAAAPTGLPLFFEPGHLKADGSSEFLARGENGHFLLAPTRVQFILWKRDEPATGQSVPPGQGPAPAVRARAGVMQFVGANRQAVMRGTAEMPGKINYLLGNEPQHWRTGVATFARLQVDQLYPGIDLVYYGNHRQLEYDFEVAPRADPALISFRFEGVDRLAIGPEGDLVLTLGEDQVRHQRPALYQVVGGKRVTVSGGYRITAQNSVGFVVGRYDRDIPLIIDPTFSYSTYFGGNNGDAAYALKVDASGSVYITGATFSTAFLFSLPTNAFQATFKGGTLTGDAFVAKLDRTGSQLLYYTYLGGSQEDAAYDLALDSGGNAYLAGTTSSSDFPTKNALFPTISGTADPTIHVYPNDAFVAELNTNGSALVFSTYLGGGLDDVGFGVAVDPAGFIYVTGYSDSTNFPTVNALQSANGGNDDVFVAKFAPGGTYLVYSTFMGGLGADRGEAITADENGFAYVTGYTMSTNFPYVQGFQSTNSGGADAFVTCFNPVGELSYSTYLGGTFSDFATRIALDAGHNAVIAGTTVSTNFPRASVPIGLAIGNDGTNSFNYDVFVARVDPFGQLLSAALFGGVADDAAWGLALDPAGRVFVAGTTLSTNYPVTNVFGLFRTNNSGSRDVFVTALHSNLTTAIYSGYLGGANDEYAYGIAVDAESSAYVAGITTSTDFPTTSPYQSALFGSSAAFIAKIRLFDPTLNASLAGGNLTLRWPVTAPGYLLQSTLSLNPSAWTTVPQPPTLTQGFYSVTLGPTNGFSAFRLSK